MSRMQAPTPFFTSEVHPKRDKEFRATAPPKKIIRQGRKETALACNACGKADGAEGVKLKKCRMCQITRYCSRECQKKSWPEHKKTCDPSVGAGIPPLTRSVMGNPMIQHYLRVAIAFEYGLNDMSQFPPDGRRALIRAPLYVHIEAGIEPAKIADFMNLYTFQDDFDSPEGEAMEGMFQFNHMTSMRRIHGPKPEAVYNEQNARLWRNARKDADDQGLERFPVVIVVFTNITQAVTCSLVIDEEALQMAKRAKPFTSVSALTGKKTDHPLGVYSCFEYLNTHIRSDKSNQLMLRTDMRPIDKDLIRETGRVGSLSNPTPGSSPAALALRYKMEREIVYQSHYKVPVGSGPNRTAEFRRVDRETADRYNFELLSEKKKQEAQEAKEKARMERRKRIEERIPKDDGDADWTDESDYDSIDYTDTSYDSDDYSENEAIDEEEGRWVYDPEAAAKADPRAFEKEVARWRRKRTRSAERKEEEGNQEENREKGKSRATPESQDLITQMEALALRGTWEVSEPSRPVNDSTSYQRLVAPPAEPPVPVAPRNRAERRRLEQEMKKAQKKAAKGGR